MINDILDFSKVEAGKLELESADMDLRDTLEDVARLLSVQAHAKGLELTLQDRSAACPTVIKGDAGRLRQILLNLGGNAVKFTQQGEVSLALSVLTHDHRACSLRCEVRDTGIGIPRIASKALVHTIHAGRFLDHAPVRRHRPGPVDRRDAWSN